MCISDFTGEEPRSRGLTILTKFVSSAKEKARTTREQKIFGRLSLVAERGWVGGSQQERSDDAFRGMAL